MHQKVTGGSRVLIIMMKLSSNAVLYTLCSSRFPKGSSSSHPPRSSFSRDHSVDRTPFFPPTGGLVTNILGDLILFPTPDQL